VSGEGRGRKARKGGRCGSVDLLSGRRLQSGRCLPLLLLFSMPSEEEGSGDRENAAVDGWAP
jgi:hypothetical protein